MPSLSATSIAMPSGDPLLDADESSPSPWESSPSATGEEARADAPWDALPSPAPEAVAPLPAVPTTALALGPATVSGDPLAESIISPRRARLIAVPGVVGRRACAPPGRALRMAPATTVRPRTLAAPGVIGADLPAALAPVVMRDFCVKCRTRVHGPVLGERFNHKGKSGFCALTLLTWLMVCTADLLVPTLAFAADTKLAPDFDPNGTLPPLSVAAARSRDMLSWQSSQSGRTLCYRTAVGNFAIYMERQFLSARMESSAS